VQELGGNIASQIAKLANGKIPYHKSHAEFMNGNWLRGSRLFSSSLVREFDSSLVWECEHFFFPPWEFGLFLEFGIPQSLLRDWLQIGHRVVRKIVLYCI